MPTQKICLKFERLQNSILNMFELKKVVDKTEVEHKVKVTQKIFFFLWLGTVVDNGKLNAFFFQTETTW